MEIPIPEKISQNIHIPQKTWAEETGIKERPPRVLLTSVFGPYATGDGSDAQHTFSMELFHNQVTRSQGAFSPRMFHHSWGIRMIQENVSAPSTVLDFPTMDIFEKELGSYNYDIIGISSIIMNLRKVQEMCNTVRRLSPQSKIIVGGHIAAFPGLEKLVDADHIARGDGISWMRTYLCEDGNAPIKHPILRGKFGFQALGLKIPEALVRTGATIVPSVGCPMGCKFCATSNFFGGKGRFINFFKSGEELYQVMLASESALKTEEFAIMDENFLLDRKRAMELLECMKANGKCWSFDVFASANALRQYTMGELVELGVAQVWLGLESPRSDLPKLYGTDTKELVRQLQSNGIRVIGSTIIGLEHHTPENIIDEIEFAVSHETDFHQFMLYIPFPGTPLYAELEKEGRLLKDIDQTGFPGLDRFSFHHPAISREESHRLIDWAFARDFERNGPSIFRVINTKFKGWMTHKNHPDQRVRRRLRTEGDSLKNVGSAGLWAMEQMYKKDKLMHERIRLLRLEIEKEFGISARIATRLLGPVLCWSARQEGKRLAKGRTYEPQSFIERRNWY